MQFTLLHDSSSHHKLYNLCHNRTCLDDIFRSFVGILFEVLKEETTKLGNLSLEVVVTLGPCVSRIQQL